MAKRALYYILLFLMAESAWSKENNLCNPTSNTFVNVAEADFRLRTTATNAIDKGLIVPGVTDGFAGVKPDLGAYEYGATNGNADWKAGNHVEMHYDGTGMPVPVDELEMAPFQVYPIPAKAVLFLENIPEKSEISLMDSTGKVVLQKVTEDDSMDISSLQNGLYLLQIKHGEKVVTRKILKQ